MKLDYMSRLETAEGGVTYHFSLHVKGLDQAMATELQQEALRLVSLASMEEQNAAPGPRPSVAACSAARCPDLVGTRDGKNLSRTCQAAGRKPGNLETCPTGYLQKSAAALQRGELHGA
jgi:hypothetical protein